MQIIDNALKFSNKSKVYISRKITDNHLEIAVSDNGIGISENEQNNIYKAFNKRCKDMDKIYAGASLGLGIALELAKLIKGEIIIHSNEQGGTSVVFSVPLE